MRYAKQILLDELRVLKNAIKYSDWSQYKEALKVREQKCRDLEQAIKFIEEKEKELIFDAYDCNNEICTFEQWQQVNGIKLKNATKR